MGEHFNWGSNIVHTPFCIFPTTIQKHHKLFLQYRYSTLLFFSNNDDLQWPMILWYDRWRKVIGSGGTAILFSTAMVVFSFLLDLDTKQTADLHQHHVHYLLLFQRLGNTDSSGVNAMQIFQWDKVDVIFQSMFIWSPHGEVVLH